MRITTGLELSKPKFDVVLKGLLHGYRPVKSESKKQAVFEDNALSLIVVGASIAGTTAYINNILKSECPDNILCIGADYQLKHAQDLDVQGFIVFLPELLYVSDAGLSQILCSLDHIQSSLTEESDVQTYFGPGIMELIYTHRFNRWRTIDASFHTFDYNSKPEGKTLVFNAKLFQEYGNLYIEESNGLHRETYPIYFPRIKAEAVLFDLDLAQFSDEALAYMLLRCKEVNPHVRRYVHIDLAYRQFEFNEWLADTNFFGFTRREDDDRDTERDVLTWDGDAAKVMEVHPYLAEADAKHVGPGKSALHVGSNSIALKTSGNVTINTPDHHLDTPK